MSIKFKIGAVIAVVVGIGLLAAPWRLPPLPASSTVATLVHAATSPGPLSRGHAAVESDCAQCHDGPAGVGAGRCATCHHSEPRLLSRQTTAFHAEIERCGGCHVEHRGTLRMATTMKHEALVEAGRRLAPPDPAAAWVPTDERNLDCAACHMVNDRHQGRFGPRCADCHATTGWSIRAFRHPSPRSRDCVQCHREPPSHTMEHFTMVSQVIAGRPDAAAAQCGECHRTTSWNDIQGAGWYKHH